MGEREVKITVIAGKSFPFGFLLRERRRLDVEDYPGSQSQLASLKSSNKSGTG